jgi:fused signal recognition particle receptor
LVDRLKLESAQRGLKDSGSVRDALRDAIVEVLDAARDDDPLPRDMPTVLLVVGVNGAGKTTSIAKVTRAAVDDGRKVMLAAADTFRAGAIEQIKIWGDRLGVPVIAQQAGSDPGAVAFDAMNAARSRGFDFVIIDTAGRLQTRHNLMEELKKIRGVVSREAGEYQQRVLLVIDGNTGQNGLSQARLFTEAVHCDGIMLTKLDSTARGGIALAISGELKIPVWFIGTGESAEDISEFDPAAFADALLPEPEPAA